MFRILIPVAVLGVAGCQFENREGFGEETREAVNSVNDDMRTFGDETREAVGSIGERRSAFERDIDAAARDIETWVDARTAEAGDAVDAGLTDIDRELESIREDLERLGESADAEWEAGKADIERRMATLKQKVDTWGDGR